MSRLVGLKRRIQTRVKEFQKGDKTGAHCSKGSVRKYRLSQNASTLPIVEVHRDYTEPGEFAQHVYNDVLTAVKRDFPLAEEVRAPSV